MKHEIITIRGELWITKNYGVTGAKKGIAGPFGSMESVQLYLQDHGAAQSTVAAVAVVTDPLARVAAELNKRRRAWG